MPPPMSPMPPNLPPAAPATAPAAPAHPVDPADRAASAAPPRPGAPGPAAPRRPPWRRPGPWLVLAVLALAAAGGWALALQRLQAAVLQALGPRATLASLQVGLTAVELRGLRLAGDRAAGWPDDDEARAERVRLVPDWRSVLDGLRGGPWRLHALEVDGGALVLLRGADGRLRLLPGLLDRPPAGGEPASAAALPTAPRLHIAQLRLRDATLRLYDASLGRPPHRLQLDALQAQVGPLALPAVGDGIAPTRLDLQARLQGPRHAGRLSLAGELHLGTRDATLQARLDGADLLVLQPYLLRAGGTHVRAGQLDLAVSATVRQQRLHAPGALTLTGLALQGGGLAGLPQQAVLATLARDGRIRLQFTLDGRLDDPGFSLNENLARRVAGGLAEAVGVSVSGVVEGVGGLFKGLLGR